MTAALTILWDSFRLLQARRLFWIALGISLVVALVYASIGFDDTGLSLLFGWHHVDNPILRQGQPEAAAFYVLLFTDVILKFWLAWIAVALALLSTAGIFPDFIAEGSIGISLSKPVGRLRLFLLKYFGGLMFVALQVGLFTVIVFLALGWRTGEWNLTVFWAVPLVTFVFSLVYAVAVWVGIWTRSTLFALLAAFMCWGISWAGQFAEHWMYQWAYTMPEIGLKVDVKTGQPAEGSSESSGSWANAHKMLKAVNTPLPKTRDCTLYLNRLIRMKERQSMLSGLSVWDLFGSGSLPDPDITAALKRCDERHSFWYVFGTSVLFETVVLSLAAWTFCRREY